MTTRQESRESLFFPLCVLRRRIPARTRRSGRQGAHSLERVRYGRPGGVGVGWSRWRAASDTPCPNSRPLTSPLSRAAFAVPRPKAEASCARGDAVSGSVMGSLISPAAPADALAGTTSIVTSRSRCCAPALDVPRTRIVPIRYLVDRLMMHLLLSNDFPPTRPTLPSRTARDFDLHPEHLAAPPVRQAPPEIALRTSAHDQGKLHQVPAFAQICLPGKLAPAAVA